MSKRPSRAVVRLDPDSVEARFNRAYATAQTGQVPAIIEQFKIVLRLAPDSIPARANLRRLESVH